MTMGAFDYVEVRTHRLGRHPLEHPVLGVMDRAEPQYSRPHLAGFRTAASPHRERQAVGRSFLRGRSCGTSRDSIFNPQIERWRCAWTRIPRSRRWIGPDRCCLCARVRWSGAPMITCAVAPRRYAWPWTPGAARWSFNTNGATGPWSSTSSLLPLKGKCPLTWTPRSGTITSPTRRR